MAARPRAGAPVRVCASPRASARVSPGLSGSLGAAGPARPALPPCRPARRVGRSPRTCRVLARTLAAQDFSVLERQPFVFLPECFS